MRVRDRGFALMLVLVASAGAFALAMQASLTTRAASTETRAFIDRAESARRARGAVVVALTGLLTPAQGFAPGAVESEGAGRIASRNARRSAGGSSVDEPDPSEIELPAIVRELLSGMLDEAEQQQDDAERNRENIAQLNGGVGVDDVSGAARADSSFSVRMLERFGLPAETVNFELPDDPWRYSLRFTDAIGLLDVNAAEEDQLVTYLRVKGVAAQRARAIAHQILDWRDADSFVRPLGAEAGNYEGTGIEIANDRFVALEELLYLPSMTREIYREIQQDLVLEARSVHANSAPRAVLASVPGMSIVFVDRILDARARGPLDERALRRLAPPGSDEALARLRTEPSNLVRVRVEMRRGEGRDAARRVFVGHAALGDRGLRAVAIAPVYDLPEGES